MMNNSSNVSKHEGKRYNDLFAFYQLCSQHDWYYGNSLDAELYLAGQNQRLELLTQAQSDPEKQAIFDLWKGHKFSEDFPKPAPPIPPKSFLLEYYGVCAQHVWKYGFMEGRAYEEEKRTREELISLKEDQPAFARIFDAWMYHELSNGPRPRKSDFVAE